MNRLFAASHLTATPTLPHGDTAAFSRAKGFTAFLGDILKLSIAWTMPYAAFLTAEIAAAAVAPEMVPEIAGGCLILSLGALVYLAVVPLRKPIKRVLRWIMREDVGFSTYLAD